MRNQKINILLFRAKARPTKAYSLASLTFPADARHKAAPTQIQAPSKTYCLKLRTYSLKNYDLKL
ncbi:hypothetical protein KAN5_32170 [Pseudoalteromonas sp. KAN5]|nr:hypothetical protein KAN5_32170 [Pseudoalteromonas sp. KAN5]